MKQKNKYIISKADNSDLLELAQMRWDFKIEEQIELHVSRELFIEICIKWLHENLDSNLWTFWIARKDEELIGHIFVCKIPKVPVPDNLSDAIGYITNVYVTPAYRNQRIG